MNCESREAIYVRRIHKEGSQDRERQRRPICSQGRVWSRNRRTNDPEPPRAGRVPTCTAPIRMAVQARLFTKDRVTLVKETPRAPMTGLVTAARLSSNGDTGWRRGFRALRVKGNVHVAAPASAQSGSYVVGITYDYQNTDTDTIRCKTVVPNEEYRCEFLAKRFSNLLFVVASFPRTGGLPSPVQSGGLWRQYIDELLSRVCGVLLPLGEISEETRVSLLFETKAPETDIEALLSRVCQDAPTAGRAWILDGDPRRGSATPRRSFDLPGQMPPAWPSWDSVARHLGPAGKPSPN